MMTPDLSAAAFPTLDQRQMDDIGRCTEAAAETYRAGQTLIEVGDRDFKFFVVRAGEIAILDPSAEPPKTIAVHAPGQFTGDVSHLTGNPSVVRAVARVDAEVYAISPDRLRALVDGRPDLGDLILQAFIARRQLLRESEHFTGVRVIGSCFSRDTFRIRDFLAKNRVPFAWLDLESDPEVIRLLRRFGLAEEDAPVVVWGKQLLRNPSNQELAEALGIRRPVERVVQDLIIVGAGPAGLAAAVYGASEGLSTLVLERLAPGGQAGSSMRIENYLGFPTGITGSDLADRAVVQANKFGAAVTVPGRVVSLALENGYWMLHLDTGETATGKCLLIATGADYRRLEVDGCDRYEGCGVYYAATPVEAQMCRGSDVVVVGGGNSAGQAVVFLAAQVRRVFLAVRGDDLSKSMSSYLIHRIFQTPNVEVLTDTTVRRMAGDRCLRSVEVVNAQTAQARTLEVAALFSFIGAVPRTDWLPPGIARDAKGFVHTGTALDRQSLSAWQARRPPFLLETSCPGVFAAGDVRAGSVKRVASAVGEGAMAVQLVHEHARQA